MRLRGGILAIGAAVLGLAAAAPAGAAGSCVLHVTGAKPRPFKPSAFVRVKGPIENADDPATKAYQFNPVTRAAALTDAELRTLFPAGTAVTIVREPGITKEALTKARGPLFARKGACDAELIVSDLYDVIPSGAPHPYGLIGALLAGRARVEAIFTFRRFEAGSAPVLTARDRESGRLPEGGPGDSSATLADVLTAATSKAFAGFAEQVARRGAQK